jgi:phenylacetate-CoA ligase
MQRFSYYDRDLETMDRAGLRELQRHKLRLLLPHVARSRFYAEKLSNAGIEPSNIGLENLTSLPFTTKHELQQEQQAHPPFGRLLTYPRSRYRYLHQTSGTSGQPLRVLDTEEDWEWWMRCWSMVYRAAGVSEDDVVFCAFSFGPYLSHWAAMSSAWRVGSTAVAGGGMSSLQRIRAILDNDCTVLLCTPTYALHLVEVASEHGIDLASSAVRITIHAGEPGASIPSVKNRLEEGWGARCFDHAGATEVGAWAYDCEASDNAIHLNETEFIFEIIDPDSGEPVSEGIRGEVVITNLGRFGLPFIRYRTGDLVEVMTGRCDCGRSLARIRGGVVGRADDMLIVRGVNLYPSIIDNLVRSIPQVIEYEVEVRRVGGMDDLLIKIETGAHPYEQVQRALVEAFKVEASIRVSVKSAAPNSLPRYEFKARRYKRID